MIEKVQRKRAPTKKTVTARPESVESQKRELEALELREAGLNFRQIGQRLGVSHTWAHKLVKAAMDRIALEVDERAEAVRQLELTRLDRMQLVLWAKASSGSVAHVDRMLRIMERRARLLGLDAPTKSHINVDVATLTDEQLEALARGT